MKLLILCLILGTVSGCVATRPKTTIEIEAPIGERPAYKVTVTM